MNEPERILPGIRGPAVRARTAMSVVVPTWLACWAVAPALPAFALAEDGEAAPARSNPFGEVVRAPVSMDFPPYEYVLEDGTIEGFHVDVLRAVARTMGFKLELRPNPWHPSLAELRSGEVDVISGMLRSEARDEWVDFATPLISVDDSIFVKRGTRGVLSAEDLRGRSVLVERDSLMHEFLIAAGCPRRQGPSPPVR